MSATAKKPAVPPRSPVAKSARVSGKPARASQLRAQTRKLLGKHYRAKYGVR